eukprot:scaffold173908_cov37-Prasinocladus_malaysianus.AAC.1
MLFDEWMAFKARHRRCPRDHELEIISERAFYARCRALRRENPSHPRLLSLTSPVKAMQYRNVVNNERRRRSKEKCDS